MSTSKLPNYLRTYRRRLHLSQDDVAFLLGSKSGAQISRYERAQQAPTLRILLAYQFLLGTPIRELYGGVAQKSERDLKKRIRRLIQELTRGELGRLSKVKVASLAAISKGLSSARSGINP